MSVHDRCQPNSYALRIEVRPHNSDLIAIMTQELASLSAQSCNTAAISPTSAIICPMVLTLPVMGTLELSAIHSFDDERVAERADGLTFLKLMVNELLG